MEQVKDDLIWSRGIDHKVIVLHNLIILLPLLNCYCITCVVIFLRKTALITFKVP